MKTYQVLQPLHHGGRDYGPGDTIEFSQKEDRLVELLQGDGTIVDPEAVAKAEAEAAKKATVEPAKKAVKADAPAS